MYGVTPAQDSKATASATCEISISLVEVKAPAGCWLHARYNGKTCFGGLGDPGGLPQWSGAGPDGTLLYYSSIDPVVAHDGNGGAAYAYAGSAAGSFRIGATAGDGTTAFVDLETNSDGRCRVRR